MSDPATRAYWWAVRIGAHRARNPEGRIRAELVRQDWAADDAWFGAACVRWWCLNGQRFAPLGDEPVPDALDVAQLAEHVAVRA
jgi:hypothetical protein